MLKDAECFTHIYLRIGRMDMRLGIDGLLIVGDKWDLTPQNLVVYFSFAVVKRIV